jgi:hypothetical protein
MRRRVLLVPLCLAAACSSTDNGTVQILITDPATFTAPPAVTTLTVLAVDTTGDAPTTLVANAPLSATTIDLGSQNENNVDSIEVTGAANGVEVVGGSTLPVQLGELAGLSLPIFVQRLGQLVALPPVAPAPQPDARQAPVVAEFEGQYLFIGGGTDASLATTSELYDFSQFALLPQPPTLVTASNAPLAPVSVAFVGTVALLIDQSGAATYFDFSGTNPPTVVMPPVGDSSFGDVAGGATVIADDGTEFIVGATRTSGTEGTSSVLEINPNDTSNANYPNGNMSWLSLTASRQGASATWVTGFGLVVAGGSSTASGAELLALPPSTSTSTTTTTPTVANGKELPFSPDPSIGAGAASLGGSTVLLAGGVTPALQDAGVRQIDIGCTSACPVTTWVPALPEPIMSAQAFALPSGGPPGFVVGNEPFTGVTHAFLLTTTTATEVKTKVTHTNATATLSPVGSIVVVGGANDIESFLPSITSTP